RRRPAAQAGESDLESRRDAHRAARSECGSGPVDKRSRRGPAAGETSEFAARNPFKSGATGRICTHDPLVRSEMAVIYWFNLLIWTARPPHLLLFFTAFYSESPKSP